MFPCHYDVHQLELLAKREQYTVFRYRLHDGTSTIIKRAHVDTSTLKYMMREKAMLGYLKHESIAQLVKSFSPALDLGDFTDTFVQRATSSRLFL
jgi:hypothetical protein